MFGFLGRLWSKALALSGKSSRSLFDNEDLEVEFLRQTFYDEILEMEVTVELVCTCGLPVAKAGSDGFYCLHCDRACVHGLRLCAQCGYAMLDREIHLEDEN